MRFLQRLSTVKRVDRREFLLGCATGRRVLHVGCVDSGLLSDRLQNDGLLHRHLRSVASELWGLDSDSEGIRHLTQEGYSHLVDGSAEDPPDDLPRNYFDVVIAGEVIEHIRNVGRFLDSAASVLARDGTLVITTPNALRFYNPLTALLNRELVHPDHVAWYTPHTLRRAVEYAPFTVETMHVYECAPCTNPENATSRVGKVMCRGLNRLMGLTHAMVVPLAPYTAEGLIVTARVRAQ